MCFPFKCFFTALLIPFNGMIWVNLEDKVAWNEKAYAQSVLYILTMKSTGPSNFCYSKRIITHTEKKKKISGNVFSEGSTWGVGGSLGKERSETVFLFCILHIYRFQLSVLCIPNQGTTFANLAGKILWQANYFCCFFCERHCPAIWSPTNISETKYFGGKFQTLAVKLLCWKMSMLAFKFLRLISFHCHEVDLDSDWKNIHRRPRYLNGVTFLLLCHTWKQEDCLLSCT